MENKKNYIDGVDVSECEHYRAEIETKMPYGEYEIQKDKCHYSGIEIIQNCKGNKGCIYKQLKRLEQENFELKESLKVFQRPDITKILTLYKVGDIELLEQKCDKLQAENERLKEEIKQYKKYKFLFEKAKEFKEKTDKWASKCLAENEDLKDTIKRTVCQSECFRYKQANNYKQTLQEIRELIKKLDLSLGCAYGDYDCDNCSDINEETVCKIKLQNIILDKINEVIGAE